MIENKIQKSFSASSGSRLYQIRHQVCSNRLKFSEKHGISSNTLFAWENDKSALTKKGAEKLVEAFAREGVFCTVEWLLEEKGEAPTTLEGLTSSLEGVDDGVPQDKRSFQSEINLFILSNPSAKTFKMSDDSMEPVILKNDVVGGVLQDPKAYKDLAGKPCVVIENEESHHIKLLVIAQERGRVNLSALNLNTKNPQPVLFNIDPKEVYKITRIWRES